MRVKFQALGVILLLMLALAWRMRSTSLPPAAIPPHRPMPDVPMQQPKPSTIPKRVTPRTNVPVTHNQSHPEKAAAPIPVAVPIAPPAAPPRISPAVVIPSAPTGPQEWKGNNDTSITHPGQIVVLTDRQWIHFWSEHHPDEVAPDVDFSRDMVVGVFLGLRPSDGFFVRIDDVKPMPDKTVVNYIQIDPPTGTFQIGVSAYPYDIKVIPRTNPHVTFNRLTPQYQRGVTPAVSK